MLAIREREFSMGSSRAGKALDGFASSPKRAVPLDINPRQRGDRAC
jgi:hypothetical protein